jgi:hypothetical protein
MKHVVVNDKMQRDSVSVRTDPVRRTFPAVFAPDLTPYRVPEP